ncbi:hypothetical protein [uncultured Microbacterium sp.]|uniref:hypothetical protein n=1 Tax=uncultured Microbacterium sp. TaxID=191216 RepID=UPI0025D05133|nr:hypothetical protein [uncultured Microbacterium sp.]
MTRREVETTDYVQFAKRIIRAAGERGAAGDDFELGELASLRDDVEAAITHAVRGMHDAGYSWQYIADGLGITRQSAHARYAEKVSA